MRKVKLNLRKVVAIVICLTASTTMFAQETGVVINGVKWASSNVDTPGTFAEKPESPGMFYQWNRKIAWATTGSITGWNTSNPKGTIWEKPNDPSPAGWRVPTMDELNKLLDKDKVNDEIVNVNGVNGHRFTDKATGNFIFMPYVGFLNEKGAFQNGMCGFWSSTQEASEKANALLFFANTIISANGPRNSGLSVRCVAE